MADMTYEELEEKMLDILVRRRRGARRTATRTCSRSGCWTDGAPSSFWWIHRGRLRCASPPPRWERDEMNTVNLIIHQVEIRLQRYGEALEHTGRGANGMARLLARRARPGARGRLVDGRGRLRDVAAGRARPRAPLRLRVLRVEERARRSRCPSMSDDGHVAFGSSEFFISKDRWRSARRRCLASGVAWTSRTWARPTIRACGRPSPQARTPAKRRTRR